MLLAWVVVAVVLGVLAPRAEHALSGGGWQADGSESVEARRLIDRHFDGQGSYALLAVVSSRTQDSASPGFRATVGRVAGLLRRDPAVGAVPSPAIAPDGRVAVVRGGAAAGTAGMVRAASRLRGRLEAAAGPGIEHGFPLRLIAPGWYGVANVKWLTRIEVMDQRWAGRFMARDYVTIREPHAAARRSGPSTRSSTTCSSRRPRR